MNFAQILLVAGTVLFMTVTLGPAMLFMGVPFHAVAASMGIAAVGSSGSAYAIMTKMNSSGQTPVTFH